MWTAVAQVVVSILGQDTNPNMLIISKCVWMLIRKHLETVEKTAVVNG